MAVDRFWLIRGLIFQFSFTSRASLQAQGCWNKLNPDDQLPAPVKTRQSILFGMVQYRITDTEIQGKAGENVG